MIERIESAFLLNPWKAPRHTVDRQWALRELGADPSPLVRLIRQRIEAQETLGAQLLVTAAAMLTVVGGRVPFGSLVSDDMVTELTLDRSRYLHVAEAVERANVALRSLAGVSDAIRATRAAAWGAAFGGYVGAALHLEHHLRRLNVLILGETGTGKELVARAIGEGQIAGAEKKPPFVARNVAEFGESLVESELFGHVKGAFTGAHVDRKGAVLQAAGGVLFLDEVGDLPPATQVKLLRVMETNLVRPVGGDQELIAPVRYVAATACDIPAMVEAGSFRRDLYERLAGIVVTTPPLRERRSDIWPTAQAILDDIEGGAQEEIRQRLEQPDVCSYGWPGNVRELSRFVRQLALGLEPNVPAGARTTHDALPPGLLGFSWSEEELTSWYAYRVLEACGGRREAAARILKRARTTLDRRLGAS